MKNHPFLDAKLLSQTFGFLPSPGLLLAVALPSGSRNIMTIGWVEFGIIWNRPVCVVMIRPTRHTYSLIEQSCAFTINIPISGMNDVLDFCGHNSGRDVDKIRTLGLSVSLSKKVNSIVLDNCAFSYECQVIGKCDISPDMLVEDVLVDHYKSGIREANYHRIYLGEIMNVHKS